MLAKWNRNQKLQAAAIAIPIVVGLVLTVYTQAPKYDYSFSNRAGYPADFISTDGNGIATINLFVHRYAEGSGNVKVTVWGTNVVFADTVARALPVNPLVFDKTVTKTDGWSGNSVFVEPDPNADSFTLQLEVKGDFPSFANKADPVQITYKKNYPGNYELVK